MKKFEEREMSVEGPCQRYDHSSLISGAPKINTEVQTIFVSKIAFSSKLPVTSIRTLNKLAKNVSSVSKDDSLTSLDWLSCLGTPQPSVKEPRPAQYTPKELIRLSFRLARHDVSKLDRRKEITPKLPHNFR